MSNDTYAIFFSDFLYKSICCGYSFELHRQVDEIQISTDNICLYKEVAREYTCNLKTTELLDCALLGVCVVIRSTTAVLISIRAAPCGNVSSCICGQRRPRSAYASAQSDQDIHCPLPVSLDTIENVSMKSKCPDEALRMRRMI